MVLPVPGGPNSKIPLQGFVKFPLRNSSGRCKGSITSSRRVFYSYNRERESIYKQILVNTVDATGNIRVFGAVITRRVEQSKRKKVKTLTLSKAPMSSKRTPNSLGGITSVKSLRSKSLSVCTSLRDFCFNQNMESASASFSNSPTA